jgi:glutamyl-tRNA synthetase
MVRVRFAPSPTGHLHVGGARTALFNWLFSRHHGGRFLLRIEDTDQARSKQEFAEAIYEGLRWLGLDWDESPLHQSSRLDEYRRGAGKLLQQGRAYLCYCNPDELAAAREATLEAGKPSRYERRCLELSQGEREKRLQEGLTPAVRFMVPEGTTAFDDLVFGHVEINNEEVEDFVVARGDGMPTYQLAVVVDDMHMSISHVIRGADHISNTPKQLMLYEALGGEVPRFAHLPLILGKDKKRLSKRHGAVSLLEYRDAGYRPEAVLNFLALLGWSPGDDTELMTAEELIERFDLAGVGKRDAVFDLEKLDWMNGNYIRQSSDDDLLRHVRPFWERAGIDIADIPEERLRKTIAMLRVRAEKLPDFVAPSRYLLTDDYETDGEAVEKHLADAEARRRLGALADRLEILEDWSVAAIEKVLRGLAGELQIKAKLLIHPTRVALTGTTAGPGLFDIMEVLARERTVSRLRTAARSTR